MIVLIVSSLRCFLDVGARISSSRCTKSHQNGADNVGESAAMIDSIILAWSVWYHFLFFLLRPGGSKWGWVMVVVIDDELKACIPVIVEM